jgi:hypothetical protein
MEDQTALPASQEPLISRIAVHLKGARLFTALNDTHHSSATFYLPLWNRLYDCIGRCENNKPAYRSKLRSPNPFTSEAMSRLWKKVTIEPLNLHVKADSVPTLRLMIEMTDGNSFLDLRMSQLYLIMSIWYSNMQELPVLFPYDHKVIEDSSLPPDSPRDWPEYGSREFVRRLTQSCDAITFEFAICIRNLRLNCSYDPPGYFSKDPTTQSLLGSNAVSLSLENTICHVTSDKSNVLRVGLGATALCLFDGRTKASFVQKASIKSAATSSSFVDLNWGLECGRHTLIDGLPLPFQVTVFMTPDNHCMINLGAGESLTIDSY